jgi:hypothetical protein
MGSFYTSLTLKGPTQSKILKWLEDRPAYVSTTIKSVTTILDEKSESQGDELAGFAMLLSKHFCCPVLAVLNHDDDILYFVLYENGERLDEYNSNPGYFENGVSDANPRGGKASLLAKMFDVKDEISIETILRGIDYVFAMDRHRDLAIALGLPEYAVGIGYEYLAAGDLPPWISEDKYTHTGSTAG